jgi:hypothetical protein
VLKRSEHAFDDEADMLRVERGGRRLGAEAFLGQHAAKLVAELFEGLLVLIGERLSARTRVATFRDGILTIEVDSAAQRYELEAFRGQELLAALQRDRSIPAVRKIVFRVGSGAT